MKVDGRAMAFVVKRACPLMSCYCYGHDPLLLKRYCISGSSPAMRIEETDLLSRYPEESLQRQQRPLLKRDARYQ
jgi:hypothetical protein